MIGTEIGSSLNGGITYKEVLSNRVTELKSASLILTSIQNISDGNVP